MSFRRFVRVNPLATRYLEPLREGLLAAFPGTTWEEARRVPDGDDALCFVHHLLLGGLSPAALRRTIVEVHGDVAPAVGELLAQGRILGSIPDPPEGACLIAPARNGALVHLLLPGTVVAPLVGVAAPALDHLRALDARWPERSVRP